ncbi:MAG: bifunctional 4-hydroxy-2-oxoglutarate aldolase/2-dehydro-3-deoxy-phosphogluconate aldolase [Bacillota bacterium]
MSKAMELIQETKVVAIVRGIDSKYMVDFAKALIAGGIRCIEVTFNQASSDGSIDTLTSIRTLKETFKDELAIGAGTVMSVEDVVRAKEAGAEYIIAPNVNEAVIRKTKELGLISMPGALTPSEAAFAYECGADVVKLFPAGVFGAGYVKAVVGPLNHIPFMAVGGVSAKNKNEFIEAGCIGVGVGGNLVNKKLIEEGKWKEITAFAKEYFE